MQLTSPEVLALLLRQRDMTRAQLANGRCSRSFVTKLVNGHKTSCSPELAEALAGALKVDVELLFKPTRADKTGHGVRRTKGKRAAA